MPRPASGRGFLAHRYGRVRHASSFLPFAIEHRRLPCPGGRGSDEEVCSLYFEGCRQPIDHIDAGGIDAPLE